MTEATTTENRLTAAPDPHGAATNATGIGASGRPQCTARALIIRQSALIALLTAAAIREAVQLFGFSDDSIWWHLRTGAWVLQNHAIPRTGLFSQLPDSAWIAFSWPYDTTLSVLYAMLGARSVPLLLMIFNVALAAVTFVLAGGRRKFWPALVLSALAQFAFLDFQPLPVLFSICFFGITIHQLLEYRRRGDLKPLLWLPLLYWIWANLDAQFVLGLLLLATLLLAESFERIFFSPGGRSCDSLRIPLVHLLAVTFACIVATLLTPYSFHLFPAALRFAYGSTAITNFASMGAMNFRKPEHYFLALLFFSAFLGLGRTRSRDLFKLLLLVLWAVLAFRVQRDNWTITLSAIAVLGEVFDENVFSNFERKPARTWQNIQVAVGVTTVLLISFLCLPKSQTLESRLVSMFPVKACDYIRSHHLSAPIFNEYSWGGYVTWKLPEYPDSIDERLNLYGVDDSEAYFEVVTGKQRMETFPRFVGARTILLPTNTSIVKALTTIPALREQFREVYEDKIASVLVRR